MPTIASEPSINASAIRRTRGTRARLVNQRTNRRLISAARPLLVASDVPRASRAACRRSSLTIVAIADHRPTATMIELPTTHMIAPACAWSSSAEMPSARAGGP